jgi:hypothetical protein
MLHPHARLRPADAAHAQRESDVLGHAHVREQRIALEHHADVALVRRQDRDVAPADGDRARRRRLESGDRHEDGGLATAARPEQRDELAGADVEVHLMHRDNGSVALLQRADPERGAEARGGGGGRGAQAEPSGVFAIPKW